MNVKVINAPGFADFKGILLMEVPRVDGVLVSVVGCECDDSREVYVIESEYVHLVSSEVS